MFFAELAERIIEFKEENEKFFAFLFVFVCICHYGMLQMHQSQAQLDVTGYFALGHINIYKNQITGTGMTSPALKQGYECL